VKLAWTYNNSNMIDYFVYRSFRKKYLYSFYEKSL